MGNQQDDREQRGGQQQGGGQQNPGQQNPGQQNQQPNQNVCINGAHASYGCISESLLLCLPEAVAKP